MRILMLAHRIPYPPHTGDKTRAYHVLRLLQARHEVTLGFLIDDAADQEGVAALRELAPDLEYRRVWKPWGLVRGLGALATGGALSMAYFHSRGLRSQLTRRSREQPYDLIYAFSGPMAEYARGLGIPLVMDFVDVDSDKWRQYADHSRPPLSWLYRTEARRLEASEAEIARWASVCLLATPVEEALLRSFAPWARTAVMPNGIDSKYYAPSASGPSQPAVIFTGAMDYLPNADAVRHFCADILPLVRREVPETAFYIVGLNPSPDVIRLREIPGVTVTGAVPDVRPYYARAGVCVAPMRIGRGVQNKVLQGMAMSLPVVASSLAARGIQAEAGRDLAIADDPALFAAHVVRLLKSPTERRRLGQQGRACVEANYVWERNVDRLEPLLAAAAGRPVPPAEGVHANAHVAAGRAPRAQA
jgi:polysaccharide biosynthesis protein PslH